MSKTGITKEWAYKAYDDILKKALDLINTYNPVVMTLDSHAEAYLVKEEDKSEKVFLKQILYGVNRYAEFFKILTNGLFKANTSSTNRNDAMLYQVFAYLLIFRYDDLPRDELCSFILSQDANKMNVFLSFFFDIGRLRINVFEEWCTVFDEEYIQEFVLDGIARKYDDLESLLNKVSEKATGKSMELSTMKKKTGEQKAAEAKEVKKFQPTVQKPFKLSEAKHRLLPEPIKIEKKIKANPVPETTYQNNIKEIEKFKADRLKEQKIKDKERLEKEVIPFQFETETRPMNKEEQ